MDFAEPLMTVGQTVLLNARHEKAVKSYKDLDDSAYTVVSKPGTTGEAAVLKMIPRATYMPVNTETAGAMSVLEGRADADEPFTKEPIAWAIRKNDPDFMKFLNEFLAQIKADGRFDKIYNEWFNQTDWHRFAR